MQIQSKQVRSSRRRKRQGGQEIVEFGLMAIIFVPLMVGMFDTGMNLVKSLQANQISRDLGNVYIHGGDFSSYSMQQLAQRLATGMNLQFPSFAGNLQTNTAAPGDGIIWVTQLMYVGATNGAQCTVVGAGNCTNANSFVYTEQIVFGSSTVAAAHPNSLGDAKTNGATLTSAGIVQNPVTDAHAKLPAAAQTAMTSLWQTTANGQTALTDGEIIYAVECYFQTGGMNLGNYSSNGVSARSFF
jgi:hypothetical protein